MADLSKRAANDRVERLQARLRGLGAKGKKEGEALVSTAVSAGTGAALGALDEWNVNRTGSAPVVGNMDNALVAGGLLTGAAIVGVGDERTRRYLRDAGNGALAVFGYKWVFQAMRDRRTEAARRGEQPAEGGERGSAVRGG